MSGRNQTPKRVDTARARIKWTKTTVQMDLEGKLAVTLVGVAGLIYLIHLFL